MIKRIRSFNRYYTIWLEVMNKEYLETDFSWTESRILFERYRLVSVQGGIFACKKESWSGFSTSMLTKMSNGVRL